MTATFIAWLALTCLLGSSAVVAPSAVAADGGVAEQGAPYWVLFGPWAAFPSAAASGGSHALADGPGASATLHFVGTRLDILAMTGPKCGIASVSVDGGAPVEVDLYASRSAFAQQVFTTGELQSGLHTVRLEWTGRANPAAAGTCVGIDAATVSGEFVSPLVDQSDVRIVRRGAWSTFGGSGLSGGSHVMTGGAGDEIVVAFTGTRLDLFSMVGPKFGIASVSVDGGPPVDVDHYRPSTAVRQRVHTVSGLTPGAHVVRIVASGRAAPAAAGATIALDAVSTDGVVTQATVRHEDADPLIGRGGTCASVAAPGASGGRYTRMGPTWGAVAITFTGVGLDVIATTGPDCGIASVALDGGMPVDVDLYSGGVQYQRPVYSTGTLPYGTHTVLVSWTGRKNPASVGLFVTLDAVIAAGSLAQAAPPPPPPPLPTFSAPWARYYVIDKSDFRLYVVENGQAIIAYPIAHGRVNAPTPNATWRIGAKYYSSGVYGPRKMRLFRQSRGTFVYTAYNIHGTDNEASIGTRASAGCIRLYNRDILELFDITPIGTMVVTQE